MSACHVFVMSACSVEGQDVCFGGVSQWKVHFWQV